MACMAKNINYLSRFMTNPVLFKSSNNPQSVLDFVMLEPKTILHKISFFMFKKYKEM